MLEDKIHELQISEEIDCFDCFPSDFIILECHIENRWYDTA